MPTLKLTPYYLSLLLLAVASGVKGNTTTVTLFSVQPSETASADGIVVVNNVSPISVLANGGTVYRENYTEIITSLELVIPGTPTMTTIVSNNPVTGTLDIVEAASWAYVSYADASQKFNGDEVNCTLGTNATTGECIEIYRSLDNGTTTVTLTTSYTGQVVPLYTLTVTGPIIPTSTTSAAIILDNPIFNRLSSIFFGIFFFTTLVLYF